MQDNKLLSPLLYILDYLIDEMLARQPEAVQTFLMETAVLTRLCGPLCDALLGLEGAQSLLEEVEAGNLFLFPLDEERRWYRYHRLFTDVLQARLIRQGPERTRELHCRAAEWYAQQGMVEEAIYHALEGKHQQAAAQLIERNLRLAEGPADTTRELLERRMATLAQTEQPKMASSFTKPLSEREQEVLRLVAGGLMNAEIADHLFLSVGTVKRHIHNIFIKLGVSNRINAIARARELNAL